MDLSLMILGFDLLIIILSVKGTMIPINSYAFYLTKLFHKF